MIEALNPEDPEGLRMVQRVITPMVMDLVEPHCVGKSMG